MIPSDVRAELRVFGRVQGVGFRFATEREARRLGLCGYVRNCEDRSVEIVAEGDPENVERLVDWARRGPRGAHISGVEVSRRPASGDFAGFSVRG